MNLRIVFVILGVSVATAYTPRPTVIWHGMGDTCCFNFSMGAIKEQIESVLPGTYVYSVEIGDSINEDQLHGFIGNVNDQVDFLCSYVKTDSNLKNGFNAVGFSQGSQFLRAYVERCNDPPVYNLVTMGGQHMGVADLPSCLSPNATICDMVEAVLAFGAYTSLAQHNSVQAQYYHDPLTEAEYIKMSGFLADINNERDAKNATYKQNLITLNQLVLFKFTLDTVVVPRESEWFGFYAPGQNSQLLAYNETAGYQGDWIGLRTLDEAGKLLFGECPGNHMQFNISWFTDNVIMPYLNNGI
eukprot:TRINITY_DN296_c0_g3_i1.p1 TRINITY_DN296_c0_g3~~TRINITY_DN296_c0_g3_i1.p1  ORF type:complete len:300 (+),score=105.22 TRINITY_DN296_c0_g3_i1:94-993(+)